MMHIDINKLPARGDKWQRKFEQCMLDLANSVDIDSRNKLIDKYHGYWKAFKMDLKKLSFNKCWYSETRNPYSHYHVDHFRPKKKVIELNGEERDGYWWLTLDWRNFRLSGSVGNSKKKDNFAVKANRVTSRGSIADEVTYFLDPVCIDDIKLLNFDNEGKAIPSVPKEEKWNFERASYTIDYLDLNYPDLVEERKLKWQSVTILIKKVNDLNNIYNEEPTIANKAKLDLKKEEIRKLLAPCEELTSTTRACLRSCGQDWAYRLLEEPINEEYCKEYGL